MNKDQLKLAISELTDIASTRNIKNINTLLTILQLLKSLDNSIESTQDYLDQYFDELMKMKKYIVSLSEMIDASSFRSSLSGDLIDVYENTKGINQRTTQLENNNKSLLDSIDDLSISSDKLINKALNGYIKTIRENDERKKIVSQYGED